MSINWKDAIIAISSFIPIIIVFIIFTVVIRSMKKNSMNMKNMNIPKNAEAAKQIFRDDNKNNIPDFLEDDSPGSLKKQIEDAGQRIKNIVRNIFFVIILIIIMGMVYYYLIK